MPPQIIALCGHGRHSLLGGLKNEASVKIISDHLLLWFLTIHSGSGSASASCAETCQLLNEGSLPARELFGTTGALDKLDRAMALLNR